MSQLDISKILKVLQGVLSNGTDFITLHEPQFLGNELAYVKECLETGWVSSAGPFVDRFEKELAEYTGMKHAVAVVNGTAALQICLKLAEVQPRDEVLIPAFTFVATANAVTYCQAIPHFVDSSVETLGLNPEKLGNYLNEILEIRQGESFNRQTGRRIKVVVPMHTYGHPVDMDALIAVCEDFHLTIVEDATESLGSFYKGRHTGQWGQVSALSFNGNKVITTGGGGAILTNDENLAKTSKHLTTTAKVPHSWHYVHDQVGYNYRLPNINAALGCAQLEQLPAFLGKKRSLADSYRQVFSKIEGIHFFTEPTFAQSNYWLNVLILDKGHGHQRDPLLELTNSQGVMTRPAWQLMHKLKMFKECPRMNLDTAEHLEQCLINIPSSSHLGNPDVSA